ncbi:MAG: hypothetical protein HOJ74_10700 [Gemmatimonadales bacterium]|nr:hypothetical protein [Gemmatimonadales bacterium]MBT6375171.1 hypothetical protein [Gemmatimonadales bacterium]
MRYIPLLILLSACASPSQRTPPSVPVSGSDAYLPEEDASVGILVMAHGGTEKWNAAVREAVQPLADVIPTEIAFGMADPLSLKAGLSSLEDAGVERIAVVRMFLSGESFAEQTRYLLGLSDTPPEHFMLMGEARRLGPSPLPLSHHSEIATQEEGIMLSYEAAEIVAARALELAHQPATESVLLLAHGMGEDGANERVLGAMERTATDIAARGFAAVKVETLQEDWAEERAEAENRIRTFVAEQSGMGRRVIVVPYRLSGFGPYAEVLNGLEYSAAEGLLPHPRLSDWVSRTASEVICAQGWTTPLSSCRGDAATAPGHAR